MCISHCFVLISVVWEALCAAGSLWGTGAVTAYISPFGVLWRSVDSLRGTSLSRLRLFLGSLSPYFVHFEKAI